MTLNGNFLGSTQGKSACRVLPGVRLMSVHAWYPPEPSALPRCWAGFAERSSAFADSLRMRWLLIIMIKSMSCANLSVC